MKSFEEYLVEESKEVVFTFGRFNPPTLGHEKLMNKIASIADGNNYRIYASKSQDKKKNPLDFKTKIKVLRKMFPKHGRAIMNDPDIRNVFDILTKLHDQGFRKVVMVVGSDRVGDFDTLTNKYNGIKARHGYYNFEHGVKIVSAGDRDPDADDVSGMSASKMRAAVVDNDFQGFKKGVPTKYKDTLELFNILRSAMGLEESVVNDRHVQLDSYSYEREEYVKGNLFSMDDDVVIKNSGEIGTITMLGSNYVIIETDEGVKSRKWISDVDKL